MYQNGKIVQKGTDPFCIREKMFAGCVLAPYQITRGKLPSIDYNLNGDNVLVTDVALGGLVITADTTVAEFSAAVMACNDYYEEGDQLTFFYGKQTVDVVTGTPRARINGFKVVLDTENVMKLWDVVSELGFKTVDGQKEAQAADREPGGGQQAEGDEPEQDVCG